jgi:hypothetical protein
LSATIFIQDGAAPHIAKDVKQFLLKTFGESRVITSHISGLHILPILTRWISSFGVMFGKKSQYLEGVNYCRMLCTTSSIGAFSWCRKTEISFINIKIPFSTQL